MSKRILILRYNSLTVTRLPKKGVAGRCHTLRYPTRERALSAYITIAARLGERMHKALIRINHCQESRKLQHLSCLDALGITTPINALMMFIAHANNLFWHALQFP